MANISVDTSAIILPGERVVVRDSNDRVYVFVNDSSVLRAYKGNVVGEPASFAQQDNANAPTVPSAGVVFGISAAIDSAGIVHIVSYFDDGASMSSTDDIRYNTFHTSAASANQDTWQINNEIVAELTRQDFSISTNARLSVQIDASDIAHAFWLEGISDMGTAWSTVHHSRRTGGTWDSKTIVTPVSNNAQYRNYSAMIADPLSSVNADRPIVVATDGSSPDSIDAYYGNALAATSWVEERDITGATEVATALIDHISIAIDSNEKIIIAFTEDISKDLRIVTHLNANAWTSWETSVEIDTSVDYESPSIAIDGTDVYIFVEDATNSDINLWQDTGSGFTEETADADLPNVGTFKNVKVKWSNYNNNSPKELDYVFEDGPAVSYNTISKAATGAFEVTASQTLTHSEAIAQQAVLSRTASTILVHSSVNPIVKGFNRTVADAQVHSESIVRAVGTAVTATTILTHSEAIAALTERFVTATTVLLHSSVNPVIKAASRTATTVLTHIDSAVSGFGKSVTAVQTITHSDSVIILREYLRTFAQNLTHSEAIAKTKGLFRTVADALIHSESISRSTGSAVTATTILVHSDAIAKTKGLFRTATTVLVHSESIARVFERAVTASQTLTHIDTAVLVKGFVRTATTVLVHSDAIVILREYSRTVAQALTHSEVITRSQGQTETATTVLTHIDSAVAVKSAGAFEVTATTILTHIDSIVSLTERFVTAVTVLTHSESIAKLTERFVTAATVLVHSEIITALTERFVTATQNLTHSDSVVRLYEALRTATTVLTHSEVIARAKGFVVSATTVLVHSDAVAEIKEAMRTVAQLLIHSELVEIEGGAVAPVGKRRPRTPAPPLQELAPEMIEERFMVILTIKLRKRVVTTGQSTNRLSVQLYQRESITTQLQAPEQWLAKDHIISKIKLVLTKKERYSTKFHIKLRSHIQPKLLKQDADIEQLARENAELREYVKTLQTSLEKLAKNTMSAEDVLALFSATD